MSSMYPKNREDHRLDIPEHAGVASGLKGHCRFCAKVKKRDELLDFTTEILELYTILEFFKIDFIDLNSNLPKTTCVDCSNKIVDCYNLFQTIKESQTILYELYCIKEEKGDEYVDVVSNEYIEFELPNVEVTVAVKSEKSSIVSNTSYQEESSSIGNQSHKQKSETVNFYANDMSIQVESDQNCSLNTSSIQDFPTTSNIAIENEDTELIDAIQDKANHSPWNTYPWSCKHCGVECDSMDDLRSHGMQLHKRCYAFKCVDCDDCVFTTFNCFIEHARQHRNELRYNCPHCNVHFETILECSDHALTHWSDGQQICQWCGKMCPDANALKIHKTMSRRVPLPKKLYRRVPRVVTKVRKCDKVFNVGPNVATWNDYDWTCLECLLRFSSADLLRTHTQDLHGICFAMRCVDCPVELTTYRAFVTHVTHHRPYLSKYCPYCNKCIEDVQELKKHVDKHYTGSQKPCDQCGQMFENKQLESRHYKQFEPVRRHKYLTTKDLTCEVCKKVFKTACSIKKHKKIHDVNRKKEHVCDTCGKAFYCKSYLKTHVASHASKTFVCKVCDKKFSNKLYLQTHVLTHLENKFVCDHCARGFKMKRNIKRHMIQHHIARVESEKYECNICFKLFNTPKYLKTHTMIVHCAERSYQCQNCEKTFTNWGNCNKHMMRIHKTTLAKTKVTPQGRIPINKVKEVSITTQVNKQWMEDLIRDKGTAKKKKE